MRIAARDGRSAPGDDGRRRAIGFAGVTALAVGGRERKPRAGCAWSLLPRCHVVSTLSAAAQRQPASS